MDQLNKKDDPNKEPETKALEVVQPQPPTTYGEFMKSEKLVRMTCYIHIAELHENNLILAVLLPCYTEGGCQVFIIKY